MEKVNLNIRQMEEILNRSGRFEEGGRQVKVLFQSQLLDIDNLINVCTNKIEVEPNHRKALFIRASSLLKKNMLWEVRNILPLSKALEDCNRLISLDNYNCGAYYIKGYVGERKGEVSEEI